MLSGWAVICLMRACLARLDGLAGPPADLVLSLSPIAPATWRQCCWPLRGPIAHGHDIHSLGRGLSSPIKRAGDWVSALACRACMLFIVELLRHTGPINVRAQKIHGPPSSKVNPAAQLSSRPLVNDLSRPPTRSPVMIRALHLTHCL